MRVNEDDEILGYKAICVFDKGLDINDHNGLHKKISYILKFLKNIILRYMIYNVI